jgi:hypothetical protein
MSGKQTNYTCVCCLFILLIAGLYLLWYYYGSLPVVLISGTVGGVVVLLAYNSRKVKKAQAQLEHQKTMDAIEQRRREEEFEKEQQDKGLTKYVDEKGNIKWGTLAEVAEWVRTDKGVEAIIDREKVKIRCPYCGKLYDEYLSNCPNCGASR